MKTQWDLPGFNLNLSSLFQNGPTLPAAAQFQAHHTALRGKFDGPVGFYNLPAKLVETEPECLKAAVKKLRGEYNAALVLGIGGSYLGAASAVDAVGTPDFPLVWVSNIDPAAIARAKAHLKNRHVATIIISKSGNTTETLAAFYHLSETLDPKGFVVITDPSSGELRKMATENNWAAMEVPPAIGGRFSVLTPVGLLPGALGGVDTSALIRGAAALRSELEKTPADQNPAYVFAAALHGWDAQRNHSLHYLMPYWSNLRLFAEWYVQLWGESLGKKTPAGKRIGPTAVAALGTTDQHSLLQLFTEGPLNKVVGFVDVESQGPATAVGHPEFAPGKSDYLCRHTFEKISHEALVATQQSLTNAQVPTYRLTVPQLDAHALGALYFFFETATAFAGELYGINAFDQPGVEESKKLLHAALSHS
ncbi:hypothetical protein K2X33_11120 [bacterium]|nr:hypothetical protein [bacterium]